MRLQRSELESHSRETRSSFMVLFVVRGEDALDVRCLKIKWESGNLIPSELFYMFV